MEEKKQQGFFDGNPRMIFVFGLVTGVAVTMVLGGGGISMPTFASNGNGGRAPVVNTGTQPSANPGTEVAGEIPPVGSDEHILGDLKKAKVVLVEYSDFECPFCERHHPTIKQLMNDFGDDIAWVYRHFPLSFHAQARPAALASECAAEQGKFWEYGDELFANQGILGDSYYTELADDLGLNVSRFQDCYDSDKYADVVDADYQGGVTAGVSGTPATFVNGQMVSGAVPYETLKAVVEAAIESAN